MSRRVLCPDTEPRLRNVQTETGDSHYRVWDTVEMVGGTRRRRTETSRDSAV